MRHGFESTVWSVDNGLPQNSNQRVLQGSDGSIWMGGFGIPARFDGYEFRAAELRGIPEGATVRGDGLTPCPGGQAMCAVVLGNGIWRTLGDSLVERIAAFDLDGYTYDGYTESIIVETSKAADASLYFVGADTTYRLGSHPPYGIVRSGMIARSRDGTIYSYSVAGQIWKLSGGAWSLHASQPVGFRTSHLFSDADGTAWTMGEAGIHRITADGLETFSDLNWARHIVPYHDGYLAAARAGVFRLSSDGTLVDTLATLHANWIYEDSAGMIWLALESDGVMRLRPHRIGIVDVGEFGASGVRSLLRDRDGSVWTTGNCEGVLNFDASGRRSAYLASDEALTPGQMARISNCFWTVAQTPDGAVWTTGMGGRIHRIRDERIRMIDASAQTASLSLEGGSVVLFTDRDGMLWTSRNRDGRIYRRSASGAFVHVPAWHLADGAERAQFMVQQFFQDRDGVVWIGGPGYVARFDGVAFAPILRVEGGARTFAQAEDGTLYVGTYGGGIYQLGLSAQIRGREETLHSSDVPRFRASNGLPDDFVSLLHLDARGRLWSAHNQGLARTHRRDLDAFLNGDAQPPHVRTFTSADGLPSTEANGGFQGAGLVWPDGKVWLPTIKGIAVLDPELADDAQPPPPPYLRSAEVDGMPETCSTTGPCALRMSSSDRRVRFRIGAITAEHPRNIELNVRLSGDEWERVTPSDRSITYAGLSGGSYRLEARARSADGEWGDAHVLATLAVPTPIYETPWFLIGAALALALGIVSIVGLRDRSIRKRERTLQRAVDQQTEELRGTSVRVEAQNLVLADLVTSKERVMRMVSHDLKNPIGGIVGLSEAIKEDLPPDSETAEMIGIIHEAGEQALLLIHSILDAETGSASAASADLPVVDLRNVVRSAAALSQGFARTKGQRIHTLLHGAPAMVRADALRLRLIVDNLVSNALKYAPLESDVYIGLTCESGHAVLTVDDEGPGIPVDQRSHVFDPYTRLNAQPTGAETATGLGLFLAREIVQQYDGTIEAGDSPQGGARFLVRLPLAGD